MKLETKVGLFFTGGIVLMAVLIFRRKSWNSAASETRPSGSPTSSRSRD